MALHAASGTLIFLISLSILASFLRLHIDVSEFHLLHVVSYHHVLPGGKKSFQLVNEMLWEPLFFWEFHLYDKLLLADILYEESGRYKTESCVTLVK